MTYLSQQTIEAKDYNQWVWGSTSGGTLVTSTNNINLLWGPGYGAKGLNQDMSSIIGLPLSTSGAGYNDKVGTLSQVNGVSAGDSAESASEVTAQQWIGFLSALNRTLYHQNQSNVSLSTNPGFGRTIEIWASLSGYLNSAASGMGTSRAWTTRPIPNGTKNFPWIVANTPTNQTTSASRSCYWPTGNDARWFYNGGGYIRITLSASGASNDRSAAVATVINDLGYIDIYGSSNSGFTNSNQTENRNKGYWNLGTSYVQLGGRNTLAGTTYQNTGVTVYARVTGNTTDGAAGSSIDVRVDLSSGYGGTGGEPQWATDNINLTLSVTMDCFDPAYSGSMLQRTWSDPSFS